MKAEERKHLKENELQTWISRAWQSVTSGSTANTIVWAVILVGLLLAIGWRYYSKTMFTSRSNMWYALDNASSSEALKDIAKENKGSSVGRVARFDLARFQLQDALSRLDSPTLADRQSAADDLQSVRDLYRELSDDKGLEQSLIQEAMMNVAKAEETLAGVPKADNEVQMRGSLSQAVTLYQALASKYSNSYLGGLAATRAKDIDDHRTQIEAFYMGLSKDLGKPAPPPDLPKGPDLPKLPLEPPKSDGKANDQPKADAKPPEAPKL
jgi:hypothetical protein